MKMPKSSIPSQKKVYAFVIPDLIKAAPHLMRGSPAFFGLDCDWILVRPSRSDQ